MSISRRPWRRPLPGVGAVLAALLATACDATPPGAQTPGRPAPLVPVLSLFALGDSGKRPGLLPYFDTLHSVSVGLALEDERAPADALVLLGDNFYPSGLEPQELLQRIADNVVAPFCRFVRLGSPEPAALTSACPADRRRPRPLYAVLGNHDVASEPSPFLQRRVLPRYVPSWHMPEGLVETIELPHGVSLLLLDGNSLLRDGDAAPLRDALTASAGPFRIIANHYPLADDERGRLARGAIESAGVSVQLWLAGHEHNLQLDEPARPGPALEVVSGGGSDADDVDPRLGRRPFSIARAGFTRIDLVPDDHGGRLFVSMLAVPGRGRSPQALPTVAARWSVGVAGDVRRELP